jgi:hypothetical protein
MTIRAMPALFSRQERKEGIGIVIQGACRWKHPSIPIGGWNLPGLL